MSKPDDPRLDTLVNRTDATDGRFKVAIIGYPCDLGVARNGGRLGAKLGPETFRQYLSKIGSVVNPEFGNLDLSSVQIQDCGDVVVGESSLENVHHKLRIKVKQALDDGFIPFVVGGGNDQSYANARALMDHLESGDISVINIDAHLDVRPLLEGGTLAHSGSPFRQLLEDANFSKIFVEFGCQGAVCGSNHAQYVKDKGGRLLWLNDLRKKNNSVSGQFAECLNSFGQRPIFVSFDIDSIQSSDCPGVSAPAVIGLTGQEALNICKEAGKNSHVKLVDMSEFNPGIETDRTARLVVHMFYYFLLGLAERS